ncbi:MAG: hypothetical protein HOP20_06575 [Sulfuriferula sp.]|nr:hypothetical protein [Sulfuriferula sp.]
MYKTYRYLGYVLLVVLLSFNHTAKADCFSDAASCVVNSAKAGLYAQLAVGEVLAFTALHAECVAAIAAQDYVSLATMTTISGLAAAGQLNGSYDGCKNDLYGSKAKLILAPLVSVVPNNDLKKIINGEVTTGIEALISSIPFPGTLPTVGMQINCGCAVASVGSGAIQKIKKSIDATAAAVDSCGDVLACVGGPALAVIKSVGKALGSAAKYVASCSDSGGTLGVSLNDCGEAPPDSDDVVYGRIWQVNVAQHVENWITGKTFSLGAYSNVDAGWDVRIMWEACNAYYDDHRFSEKHADSKCNEYRDKRFGPETSFLFNARMSSEFFPKEVYKAARASSDVFEATYCGNKQDPSKKNNTAIDASSDGNASLYSGMVAEKRAACSQAIMAKIGISGNGGIVAEGKTVVAEAKKIFTNYPMDTGLRKNYDFNKAYQVALSKYVADINSLGEKQRQLIQAESVKSQPTLILNTAYRAIALETIWPMYRDKCPPEETGARKDCLLKTGAYLGVIVQGGKTPNGEFNLGDFGSLADIDFLTWQMPPVIYQGALATYKKQGVVMTADLASAWVMSAFVDKAAELAAIAPQSIKDAKVKMGAARMEQEQLYSAKLDAYTASYSGQLTCTLPISEQVTHTCEYSKTALNAMFLVWKGYYTSIDSEKSGLNEVTKPQTPYGYEPFKNLIKAIEESTGRAKLQYADIKKAPDAIIKNPKKYTVSAPIGADKLNKLAESTKDKKAQSATNNGLSSVGNNKVDSISDQAADVAKNKNIGGGSKLLVSETAPKTATTEKSMTQAGGLGETLSVVSHAVGNQTNTLADQANNAGKNIGGGGVLATNSLANVSNKPSFDPTTTKPMTQGAGLGDAVSVASNAIVTRSSKNNMPSVEPTPVKNMSDGLGSVTNTVTVAAFDKPHYDHVTTQALENKWLIQCKNEQCKIEIRTLIRARISDVLRVADTGMDLRIKANLDATELRMDNQYNPQMQAKVNASATPKAETFNNFTSTQPVGNVGGSISGSSAVTVATKSPEPPFDKNKYQHLARQGLESKWLMQCKNEQCKNEVRTLINARIAEVLRISDTGTDLRIKANLDITEGRMDNQYNPQIQAKVNASMAGVPVNINTVVSPSSQPVKNFKAF